MNNKELKQRIKLAWRIVRGKDCNLVKHAKRELAADYETGDPMNIAMADHLVDMVRVFSTEGHSGFSASYATAMLNKLLSFAPIRPLTGVESEWVNVAEEDGDQLFQNNRCSHVFKTSKGAYDIDGVVLREPSGTCYTTGKYSRVPVKFPYVPKTVYVDVPADASDDQIESLVKKALAKEKKATFKSDS